MLAYIFWHKPFADVTATDYEAALAAFHADLGGSGSPGLISSATYRITETPWLDRAPGYEDWCFVESSAALDPLNKAAVAPERWDVHAGISSKTDYGHGGLYYRLSGEVAHAASTRAVWLKRPRGIRYEQPLSDILDNAGGVLGCWRKQMVLGPGHEFVILGDASLRVDAPQGWESLAVSRDPVYPDA